MITAPLLFHKTETLNIFNNLNFDISQSLFISNEFLYVFIAISLFANIIISLNKQIDIKSLLLMDFISILLLNLFLESNFSIYNLFLLFYILLDIHLNYLMSLIKKILLKDLKSF